MLLFLHSCFTWWAEYSLAALESGIQGHLLFGVLLSGKSGHLETFRVKPGVGALVWRESLWEAQPLILEWRQIPNPSQLLIIHSWMSFHVYLLDNPYWFSSCGQGVNYREFFFFFLVLWTFIIKIPSYSERISPTWVHWEAGTHSLCFLCICFMNMGTKYCPLKAFTLSLNWYWE